MDVKAFSYFFERTPALYLSLWALFGLLFADGLNPLFLFPLVPLLFHQYKYIFLGMAIFCLFFIYSPKEPFIKDLQGFGIVSVKDIYEQKGLFFMKGELIEWNEEQVHLPISFKIKKQEEHKIAFYKTLFIAGNLKRAFHWQMHIAHYEPISYSYLSFPWLRFYAKQHLQKKMEKGHPNGAILSSLLFGSAVPKSISTSIKRFGLSHLFAISGFHFNLITTLLALLLRPFISYRVFHWTILSLLVLYALLIGPNPSLLRGFLAQAILFLGLAVGKESLGLNTIGIALFFIVLFFPQLVPNLGFIFSFIITFALLLLYPLISQLFPNKPKWLMGPLALLVTVELASFPLNLTLFGSYPLLSPLYNLIVTPLISFSLFLAPLTLIPYICDLVYLPLNIALWTFEVPSSVDVFLYYPLSKVSLTLYLTLLFMGGIYFKEKLKEIPISTNSS